MLEAEGRSGLLPLLERATGSVLLERFKLEGLLAVGRQCFVFTGSDLISGRRVVIKQAAFDYNNLISYSRAQVAGMRQALLTERDVLMACTTHHLPEPIGVIRAPSPMLGEGDSFVPLVFADEVFLIEEQIEGHTLNHLALQVWTYLPAAAREDKAKEVAREFIKFWETLQKVGWHYGDINANNLLIETASGRLRVVDGASAVASGKEVILSSYTPAFTTPRLFAAFKEGRPVPGNLSSVLPSLTKVLHFALTREQPLNGILPDLGSVALAGYSKKCRDSLTALLALDGQPETLNSAKIILAEWTG